jgi:calcineurin-like phosphoesterase family protein
MMNTWVIADCHFRHNNILKLTNRPFKDVDEMADRIIDNINAVVKKGDRLINLGDFSFGGADVIESYVKRIKCQNHWIVLGNHDAYSPSRYMELGFQWASRFPVIYDNYWIMSHEPVFLNNTQCFCNIHGHVHNSREFFNEEEPWYVNVSVEVINYQPVNLTSIKSLVHEVTN